MRSFSSVSDEMVGLSLDLLSVNINIFLSEEQDSYYTDTQISVNTDICICGKTDICISVYLLWTIKLNGDWQNL